MTKEYSKEYFNQGLESAAAKNGLSVSEQVDLIRARPSSPVVPYTEPETEPSWTELTTNAVLALAKPVAVLSVLASGVFALGWVVIATGAAIVAAITAFVAENEMVIGGAVLAVAALIGGVGSYFGSGGGDVPQTNRKSNTAQNITVNVNVGGGDVNVK